MAASRETADAHRVNELGPTRRSLHGIAEHILSAHARHSGGPIGLSVTVRGFETRPPGADSIALADGALHRRPDGPTVELAGTFQEVADRLGVPFGMPDPPYPPASGCQPGDLVTVDPAAVAVLVDAWARGAQALRLVAGRYRLPAREPALWPQHLALCLTVAGESLGVSPGDDRCDEPYAFAGGARRPMRELADVDAVLGYFTSVLATSDSTASSSSPSSLTWSRTP